ncbi:hypothetical protein [Halorarum salinum]|uniref:RiboL-PSP-HEPN domain-containing protein n=1 Tax=Halorarum salinum TaxID=2743089 RepID=A0A7D5Q7V7_9EURY|nr:hypothetical protein [Halobaculum salinum]QLG60497.1 hypothetical protein HUG12_01525 [Halobaculum salinum]
MTDNPSWPKPHVDYAQTINVEISSVCDFESLETYRDNIGHYESNNYTYIPLPTDGKYYDCNSCSLKDLNREQWVWLEDPIIPELSRFKDHDFLLIYHPDEWFYINDSVVETISPTSKDLTNSKVYSNPYDLLEDWPEHHDEVYEILQDRSCLSIITLADLNDRRLRAILYQLISSVEVVLSHAIEATHPDGEDLIKHMDEVSIGRWKKAEYNVGQLHPTEYMGFGDLKDVASRSSEITSSLGYDGKGDFNHNLNKARDLRNQVMHPSRNLIMDHKDVEDLNIAVKQLEGFIERCDGTISREH